MHRTTFFAGVPRSDPKPSCAHPFDGYSLFDTSINFDKLILCLIFHTSQTSSGYWFVPGIEEYKGGLFWVPV